MVEYKNQQIIRDTLNRKSWVSGPRVIKKAEMEMEISRKRVLLFT